MAPLGLRIIACFARGRFDSAPSGSGLGQSVLELVMAAGMSFIGGQRGFAVRFGGRKFMGRLVCWVAGIPAFPLAHPGSKQGSVNEVEAGVS